MIEGDGPKRPSPGFLGLFMIGKMERYPARRHPQDGVDNH
jgi:hypothetical protein